MRTIYKFTGDRYLSIRIAATMGETLIGASDNFTEDADILVSAMIAGKVNSIFVYDDIFDEIAALEAGYSIASVFVEGQIFDGEQSIFLLRGLPGTGKTTLAKLMEGKQSVAIAADDYPNLYKDGVYQLDKVKDAHQWCRDRAISIIKQGKRPVVHNTFTQDWEIHPYLEIAAKYNYSVVFVHCQSVEWLDSNATSTHHVPPEIIEKMKMRFQPFSTLLPWINSGYPKPEYVKNKD